MVLTERKLPLWKRIMDLVLIVVTVPILIPIGLLISLYIKLVSSGPTLFRQERVGMGGRLFICYKFRSMRTDALSNTHQLHIDNIMKCGISMKKIDSLDDRIIPGARLLRASGLDELPQLFNVLKGEMSIVGPRPCLKYEVQYYKKSDRRRFDVLPGLTGLWQISGKNNTTFREMVSLDVLYAKNYNFLMDLKIVISTIPLIFSQLFKKS
jgi:lipopolysaccharide/colanic/teichoic acid biosynthesis glycosyltransferase